MDDEWALNDVLHKDCLMTSTALDESDFGLDLNIDSDTFLLDECMGRIVKAEPADETSDYNGSSSGSPSSSLSSPINMKDEPLGLDINFCVPFTNNFSPASSSHSPFGGLLACANGNSQASPLPPVTHFSQMHPQGGLIGGNSNGMHPHHFMNNSIMFRPESLLFEGVGESSPSPPSSDRSSPMDNAKVVNMMYEAMHPNAFDGFPSGVMNGLAAAHQQLKSRSKMHEMAVKQKLITDQDPRSQGSVQLSAEERRTLVQEGYPIPIRLPLSKSEEEALKIVRRKIKNKLSAQESRRKRKEYMDALESRVQGFINENTHLKSRLRQLEQTNKQLLMKVRVYEQTGNANGTELDPSVLRQ